MGNDTMYTRYTSRSACTSAKTNLNASLSLISQWDPTRYRGQLARISNCEDTQTDQELKCPHMAQGPFSQAAIEIRFRSAILFRVAYKRTVYLVVLSFERIGLRQFECRAECRDKCYASTTFASDFRHIECRAECRTECCASVRTWT